VRPCLKKAQKRASRVVQGVGTEFKPQYYKKKKRRRKEERKIFSEGGYQWVWEGHKERVNKGEYGRCILYSYIKIEE
jgi:hypothetical protein